MRLAGSTCLLRLEGKVDEVAVTPDCESLGPAPPEDRKVDAAVFPPAGMLAVRGPAGFEGAAYDLEAPAPMGCCDFCGDESGCSVLAALVRASRRSRKAWFTLQNHNGV